MDLLYGKLPCENVGRTLFYVGLNQRLLHLDLFLR